MKRHMSRIWAEPPWRLLVRIGLAVAIGAALVGGSGSFAATPTPSGSPPSTYDFDSSTPGIDGPTSPLLAGYEERSLRMHMLRIFVLVPLSELQAQMPPGFTANPSPAGANTGLIILSFFYRVRTEFTGLGSFGPASFLTVLTSSFNSTLLRNELLILANFSTDQDYVDAMNGLYGLDTTRLAEVSVDIEEGRGMLGLSFDVEEPQSGFKIKASGVSPTAIRTRTKLDPAALPVRFLNGSSAASNNATKLANQGDSLTIPTVDAKVRLESGGILRLPGGQTKIQGLRPTVDFASNLEVFMKTQ